MRRKVNNQLAPYEFRICSQQSPTLTNFTNKVMPDARHFRRFFHPHVKSLWFLRKKYEERKKNVCFQKKCEKMGRLVG